MPLVTLFDTPASLRDVPAGSPFYQMWHNIIDGMLGPGSGLFYNPSRTNVDVIAEHSLAWMGFPRELMVSHRDDRALAFRVADTTANRGGQEEYCEWRVTRNAARKITKVVFVTEAPEYWSSLWAADPARVLALYRTLVSPAVMASDLVSGGGFYNGHNHWNTTDGIVHFIVSDNTLNAAVQEARGSVLTTLRDNYESLPLRATNVDPRLILDVGVLARRGLMISLREPIGLYVAGYNDDGWTKPNGAPVDNYWRIVRGRPGQILRLEYEVPAGAGFVVGDIRIGGRPIEWGGQIAEHITCTAAGIAGTRSRP